MVGKQTLNMTEIEWDRLFGKLVPVGWDVREPSQAYAGMCVPVTVP